MVIKTISIAWQGVLFLSWVCFVGGCNDTGRTGQQMPLSTMDSPRAVVSYLQHAMEKREYAKVVDIIEPSEKARYVQYLRLAEGYYGDVDRLAAAIRKRLGRDTALEKAVVGACLLSPLQNNLKDGAIKWDALQFAQPATDPNRLYLQDLSGHSLVRLVKLDGEWFVTDFDGGSCGMESMDVLAEQVAYFRGLIEDLIRVVQNEQPAEVEKRVYEALGRSGPKISGADGGPGRPGGPATRGDRDPLLDD